MRGKLVELLLRLGQEVVDIGCHGSLPVDYPDIAAEVGRKVSRGEVDRGDPDLRFRPGHVYCRQQDPGRPCRALLR